jgi:superfamily II DNA/RNA helicase
MNLEQLHNIVQTASSASFRDRLLARGQARAMIWHDGILPEGAPRFAKNLSYDLYSYAYALLSLAIRIREGGGDQLLMRTAFEQSANALEAIISNGNPNDPSRGFHRLLAASAFHLGRFSARAFSLLIKSLDNSNLSHIERALALFILRSFDDLEHLITEWCIGHAASDDKLINIISESINNHGKEEVVDFDAALTSVVDIALTQNFMRGLGAFLLAIESGEDRLVELALKELNCGFKICQTLNLVPQWWCYRLAIHLIDDLWSASFHNVIPLTPPGGNVDSWQLFRRIFIALLTRRKRAEIELWPSQIEAARRAIDTHDDLVVSLPTSAGKTRIAELCILRTLAENKRVVFVTPLRALSAQTEESLRRTFGPLGTSISALYGSIGTSQFEEDALRVRKIVVATPEKLDFALRNDPALINDVGLIILDEGHMIGLGEREIRYEVQIQRLIKRTDADQRRIVCLSAILPSGDLFDDFVKWLRRDQEGSAIVSDWRPTRIRFGEVLWVGNHARLELRVGNEQPFVPNFFSERVPPKGKRKTAFPRDQRELVLATAWRLVEEGQSVLIYCPQRRSVEPFAAAIADLNERGLLTSVLTEHKASINSALTIGREWLGENHPILRCLQLGIAVHHGALPTPFRKEMERLLRDGVLKITVSSPTLAQGLNLSATSLIFHSLSRDGNIIPASEFKNVIGRAGRAFIDIEGLVVYPIYDDQAKRRAQWQKLIKETGTHSMESGLIRLVLTMLARLYISLGKPSFENMLEYVVNHASLDFPEIEGEKSADRDRAIKDWSQYLISLDTAILSLLGDENTEADQIAAKLDEVLDSSLWKRQILHKTENLQTILDRALKARAEYIWSLSNSRQRKGYFLAGLGFTSGMQLDAISPIANELLIEANGAIISLDNERAINAITSLAELLFSIPPFVPEPIPENWRDVLALWLKGLPITNIGQSDMTDVLRFVENGLIYRLPWGMEAVRVRAKANQDEFNDVRFDDYDLSLAVPAVETGTLNRSAAILMQAGFTLRIPAIKAVTDTEAIFTTTYELKAWLQSDTIRKLSEDSKWPTPESASLWKSFIKEYMPPQKIIWTVKHATKEVRWRGKVSLPPGTPVKIHYEDGVSSLMSATQRLLGTLKSPFSNVWSGLLLAYIGTQANSVDLTYYGPDDIDL